MSMNLILTRYSKIEENKYCEENCKNLEVVELSNHLYDELIIKSTCEQDIWEDKGEKSYSQRIISNDEVSFLIKKCTDVSLQLIHEISGEDISLKEQDEKLDKLRVILEVRNMLKQKSSRYADQDEIFIVVG